ncbi:MAG: hypothetical protein V8T53_00020 [Eubacteriales bacterium]
MMMGLLRRIVVHKIHSASLSAALRQYKDNGFGGGQDVHHQKVASCQNGNLPKISSNGGKVSKWHFIK